MKKLLSIILSIELIVLLYTYQYPITNYIISNINLNDYKIYNNSYAKKIEGFSINLTNDFYVKNKNDIYDVLLTIVNSGNTSAKFYCSYDYDDCIKDVNALSSDNEYLILINNIVHPFNSFKNLKFTILPYGDVEININKTYSNDQIIYINNRIDSIYDSIISDEMDQKTKILTIHDYIVNNTKYDLDNVNLNEKIEINKANYLLMNNKGICGAYTDTMALFLNKMNIENYKISDKDHIWNYVKLDKFYHLDVTWDDPVNENKQDILSHEYFLITTDKLSKIDHTYNKILYKK